MCVLDITNKMLISLLSAGIRKESSEIQFIDGVHWDKLINDANRHRVATLIYNQLAQYAKKFGVPENLLKQLKKSTMYEGMEQERNYLSVGNVLCRLKNAGIPLIVLKGLVLRELYPEPVLRTMCDFDFLVKTEDMERAGRVLVEAGYKADYDLDKHAVYIHEVLPNIELHRSMAPIGMHENYPDFEAHAWEHAIPVRVSGVQVLSLDPTDKAVYLVIHMASHVISSGFGLRQLCDFLLLIENCRNDISWKEYKEHIDDFSLTIFTDALFEVCRQLFGMEKPVEFDQDLESISLLAQELTMDIFDSGVFGKDDKERITANRMLYYSGGREAKTLNNKLKIFVQLIFPSVNKLDVRFNYAKRHHILLPVAWIHRIFYNITRKDINFHEKTAIFSPEIPTQIYSNRSKLLKGLGLIGKNTRL